mmetsp:Transcript_2348/g.3173  ORF Transcript_2348/g.3173 Transcript_2348/m.3173 type:complete len:219 (+) Transcript_2348:427-1083(+)
MRSAKSVLYVKRGTSFVLTVLVRPLTTSVLPPKPVVSVKCSALSMGHVPLLPPFAPRTVHHRHRSFALEASAGALLNNVLASSLLSRLDSPTHRIKAKEILTQGSTLDVQRKHRFGVLTGAAKHLLKLAKSLLQKFGLLVKNSLKVCVVQTQQSALMAPASTTQKPILAQSSSAVLLAVIVAKMVPAASLINLVMHQERNRVRVGRNFAKMASVDKLA